MVTIGNFTKKLMSSHISNLLIDNHSIKLIAQLRKLNISFSSNSSVKVYIPLHSKRSLEAFSLRNSHFLSSLVVSEVCR